MTTLPDFEKLRQGAEGCPSDLALDRFAAAELAEPDAERTRAHISSCKGCEERLAARRFEAIPEVNPQRMLAAIRRKLDEPRTLGERLRRWMWRLTVPLAVTAGAAAVLLLLPRAPLSGRATSGGVADSGLKLRAADDDGGLRFIVDLPAEGHVSIVAVTPEGALRTAWPPSGTPTLRPAGPGQALPGAVTLASPLRDRLYLVHCPSPAGAPACQPRGADAEPACTPGCTLARVTLESDGR